MGDLTEHFSLSEFWNLNGSGLLMDGDKEKALKLAQLLEIVRPLIGPMTITSGKRSEAHNKAEKGSPTSEHLWKNKSAACDFSAKSFPLNEKAFLEYVKNKKLVGQLICYIDISQSIHFVHVSLPTNKFIGDIWNCRYEQPRKYLKYKGKIVRP